jgi:hypothetical protein
MLKPDFDLAKGWWFPAVVTAVLLLIILIMPKRLKWKEIYSTYGVVAAFVWLLDTIIAVPFDLFDIGDPLKRGLPEILLYAFIPPFLSIIFLNYYKIEKKWVYVILFVILSSIIEWLTIKVGLMKLKGWNTLWSIGVFFIFYGFFLPWHIKFIRNTSK